MKHVLGLLAIVCLFASPTRAGEGRQFTSATVEAFERLPIQEGGRVKPIASFARFSLLRAAGTSTPKDVDGRKLAASEWLLRLVLFPELARNDDVLLVEDSQALVAVGLAVESHEKRDRWSHAEVAEVLPALLDRAHAAQAIDAGRRSPIESVTMRVAESALLVTRLGRSFDFARGRIPLQDATRVALLFPGRDAISVADVLASADAMHAIERELASTDDARERGAVAAVWRFAAELCGGEEVLAWIPPVASVDAEPDWRTPANLIAAARGGAPVASEHVEILRAAEEVASRRTDPARLEVAMARLTQLVEELASRRGEIDTVRLEAAYHGLGLLAWATGLFVLAFATCSIGWLRTRSTFVHRAAWTTSVAATLLLALAIVMRCVIRGRPPVTTLYETVLFVTVCAVLVALFVERVQRQRIHLAIAALVGACGLFLARGYELLDGQDTMPNLVAVLDTNFWLATHVTAITLGYSAGLLAAVLGTAYVLIASIRGSRVDAARQKALARSVVGVTCFALCFSVVGTILGGIWANESWGRFWGWDPKENGALLICIAQITLIHARRAGFIRDLGTCAAAAFGGTVVAFSWWGVNLLGVGLHSYGFTSGIQTALWSYYVAQWAVVALAGVLWIRGRSSRVGTETNAVDAVSTVAS